MGEGTVDLILLRQLNGFRIAGRAGGQSQNEGSLIFHIDIGTLGAIFLPAVEGDGAGNLSIIQAEANLALGLIVGVEALSCNDAGNTYAAENLYPDLHIRHKIPTGEVEYFIECKYRSSWDKDGNIDLSNQFLRYRNFAKEHNCELFIAIGIGGTPSNPDEFLIIPSRMIDISKKINQNRFNPCICDKTPEDFHSYICNYFNKRVLSKQ
jgi:hypothetical protein